MTFDDVRLIKHQITGARRFGYWVHFRDQRPSSSSNGRAGKLFNTNDYILKLNSEQDLLMLILRFK
jgi:hypothetical protein